MKKLLIALALFLGMSGISSAQVNSAMEQQYIEINGYSKDEVSPDKIFINFQISEKDTKNKTSIQEAERKMVAALRAIGVDIEKQLTINDMSSNFQKYILRRTDIMLSRDYQLEVTNAQNAAAAFAALEGAGVSNGTISRSEYSKIEDFTLQNKVKAVQNARVNATALAEAAGRKIGKAIYIQDVERVYARPYNMMFMARAAEGSFDQGVIAPDIEFQKITVESNVTVRFSFE